MGIAEIFQQFCDNLKVTAGATISYRYQRITRQLNTDFYGYPNDTYWAGAVRPRRFSTGSEKN